MSSLFQRMRISAFATPALQAFFGTDYLTFRFFDRLLPLGQEKLGPCVRVTSVSQITTNLKNGRNKLTEERTQIDVIAADSEVASNAADAVDTWLDHANFVDNRAFASPVRTSGGPPANFKLNQRGGLYPAPERMIPVESLDYKIFNVNT